MELWQRIILDMCYGLRDAAEELVVPSVLRKRLDSLIEHASIPYDPMNKLAQFNNQRNEREPQSYLGNLIEAAFDLHVHSSEICATVDYNCESEEDQVRGNLDRRYNGKTVQIKYKTSHNQKIQLYQSDYDKVDTLVVFTYIDDTLVMAVHESVDWYEMFNKRSHNGMEVVSVELKYVLNTGGKLITVHPAVAQKLINIRQIPFPPKPKL